eukprot:GGOE01001827.1.p1 GENE.GGOE01001827.1~~GGOE01001827.1.p1  ORF type:complete len:515 (-),score=81.41 GGOE01001827.1:366-1910(-)
MDSVGSLEAIFNLGAGPRGGNPMYNFMDDETARQEFNTSVAERFHLRHRLSRSQTVREVVAVVRSTLRRLALSVIFRIRVHHLIRHLRLLMQWARQMRDKRNSIIAACLDNLKTQLEERRHRYRQEIQTKPRVRSASGARSKAVDGYVALQIPEDFQLAAVKELYFQKCNEFWREFRVQNEQLKEVRTLVKDLERAVEYLLKLPQVMLKVEQLAEARKELLMARGEKLALELCLPKFRFAPTYSDCIRGVRRLMAEDPDWRYRRGLHWPSPSSSDPNPAASTVKAQSMGSTVHSSGTGQALSPSTAQPSSPRPSTAIRRSSSSAPSSPTSRILVEDLPDAFSAVLSSSVVTHMAGAINNAHHTPQRPFSGVPTVRRLQHGGTLPLQVPRSGSHLCTVVSPSSQPRSGASSPLLLGIRPTSNPGTTTTHDTHQHLPLVTNVAALRTKGNLRPLSSLRRKSHNHPGPSSLSLPRTLPGSLDPAAPSRPHVQPVVWFGTLGRTQRTSPEVPFLPSDL